MEIKFKCECGQALKVSDQAAGKMGRCPYCGKQVRIPTIEEIQSQPMPVQIIPPPAERQPPVASVPAQPAVEREGVLKKEPVRPIVKGRSALAKLKERQRKPMPGPRGKAGAKMRPRGAEEDEEEAAFASAQKKKKNLILIGVIAGIALVALLVLYLGYLGPRAAEKERYLEYVSRTEEFVAVLMSEVCNRYGSGEPPGAGAFSRGVSAVKFAFEEGPYRATEGHPEMRQSLTSYNKMRDVLKKLETAQSLLQQKQASNLESARLEQINADFSALLQDCRSLASEIEKGVGSLRKKIQ